MLIRENVSIYSFRSCATHWNLFENEKPNSIDPLLFKIQWNPFFELFEFIHKWRQNDSSKRSWFYEYDKFQGWLQAGPRSWVWSQEGSGSGGPAPGVQPSVSGRGIPGGWHLPVDIWCQWPVSAQGGLPVPGHHRKLEKGVDINISKGYLVTQRVGVEEAISW